MENNLSKKYPLETAGRLMTDKVPVVKQESTIVDVENLLLKKTVNFDTINYIYVVDDNNKLKGAISVKEVFRAPKTASVKKFLPPEIVSVRAHTDQERVAFLALKHNIKAVPVVDKDDHFLGTVVSDDILRILDSEAVEDILRFGGLIQKGSFDNVFNISLARSLKHRLPWLILGLLGGLLAAGVVTHFEDILSKNLILAAFIPLIVYMADAVGTQTEAFIIRDLAITPKITFLKYFVRQFSIMFLIGIIMSLCLFIISLVLYGDFLISIVLGTAILFAILSAVFTGVVIPYLFSKIRLDPANASGPIATIVQDILSVILYFSVASWLL